MGTETSSAGAGRRESGCTVPARKDGRPRPPCKDRPGEWLRVKKWPSKTSANSQAATARKALGAGWEIRAARLDDGSAVWVRWVGDA